MAENDRFENSLYAGWRTVAQYVENDSASPEEVNDKLVESLVNCLRKHDGIPDFHVMTCFLSAPSRQTSLDVFVALDDIVKAQRGHRHTKVAARVAMSILAQKLVAGETLEPQNLERRLAEDVCLAHVRHYFFARIRQRMIAKGKFSDNSEFHKWQIGVERSIQPRVGRLAVQLAENPDAVNLRTPKRTATKVPSSVLPEEV